MKELIDIFNKKKAKLEEFLKAMPDDSEERKEYIIKFDNQKRQEIYQILSMAKHLEKHKKDFSYYSEKSSEYPELIKLHEVYIKDQEQKTQNINL